MHLIAIFCSQITRSPPQKIVWDATSYLLNQDSWLFEFLEWTVPQFLQNVEFLRNADLECAAEKGMDSMVTLLTGEKYWKENCGYTPLHRMASSRDIRIVELLLAKGAELDSKDYNGRTPLSYAAKNGHEAGVKLLLDRGADPDISKIESHYQLPIVFALRNGHKAVVELLLERGGKADLNYLNSLISSGSLLTPLWYNTDKGIWE